MEANLVQKKVVIGRKDVIKYQLLTYCFLEKIQLSNNELECLTHLGLNGESELSTFCKTAVKNNIFKTAQTVRNFLNKASKKKLILKTGDSKKLINLTPELKVQTEGNIILDYKIIHVTKEK